MPLPKIPALLNLVATEEDQIDDDTDMAVFQGQSYGLLVAIKDQNGDPFDLGPTIGPNWTFECQFRSGYADDDPTIDATANVVCLDGPNGQLEVRLTPAQTGAMRVPLSGVARWDLLMTNVSDTNYLVGFAQFTHQGNWLLKQRATA